MSVIDGDLVGWLSNRTCPDHVESTVQNGLSERPSTVLIEGYVAFLGTAMHLSHAG